MVLPDGGGIPRRGGRGAPGGARGPGSGGSPGKDTADMTKAQEAMIATIAKVDPTTAKATRAAIEKADAIKAAAAKAKRGDDKPDALWALGKVTKTGFSLIRISRDHNSLEHAGAAINKEAKTRVAFIVDIAGTSHETEWKKTQTAAKA